MDTSFFISGPSGQLECLALAGNAPQFAITAVICHPHPLYEGTMHNKVVTTLAHTFRDLGINSVRFNFRGVGKSDGQYGDSVGELQDCLAVVDWVKQTSPQQAIILAGFSFGGAIALRAAVEIDPLLLVTIAPAVYTLNTAQGAISCPWILVQGEADDVILPETVYTFLKNRSEKPEIILLPNAGHFFHGQLTLLKQQLTDAINKYDILA